MNTRTYLIILSYLCFFMVLINGGKLLINFPTNKCEHPRGNVCIEITKCPFFNELLNRTAIPRPRFLIKLIRENQCGFDGSTPYVCCHIQSAQETSTEEYSTTSSTTTPPSIPSEAYETTEEESYNDLESLITFHPNYRLLSNDICGPIATDSRITSGTKATLNEYPWMALIAYNVDGDVVFRCGGTVINHRYVLTAAHCIDNSTIGVRLGEFNLDTSEDCDPRRGYCASPTQDFLKEKVIVNPDYNPKTVENDIALIRLATSANFSCDNVQPICLPLYDADLSGKFVTVSGWGVTEQGFKSPELLKVSVPVVPISKCQRIYSQSSKYPISSKQICAGGYKGRDSCAGDSGGPLITMINFRHSTRYIQYGIVSYGLRQCGVEGRPGIYTRVHKYMSWILDNLEPWDD